MSTRKSLQIAIKSIPETGLEIKLDLGQEWFSRWQEADPGLEFREAAVTGRVSLAKLGKDILVRGRLEGKLGLSCGRCLEPFQAPVASDFDLLLAPGPQALGAVEEELTAQDLDTDFYAGDTVDLESIIREQIILMMPLKPLCTETCQGLCPHCGANLNREICTCREEKSASPLAELAKLKIK
jgi:uncharacterized protein